MEVETSFLKFVLVLSKTVLRQNLSLHSTFAVNLSHLKVFSVYSMRTSSGYVLLHVKNHLYFGKLLYRMD